MESRRLTRADMDAVWGRVARPAGSEEMSGLRPVDDLNVTVYAAVDGSGNRHLLIEDRTGRATESAFEGTTGLGVAVRELSVSGRPASAFIDLECRRQQQRGMFSAFATDLVTCLQGAGASPEQVVARVLKRWKAFWRAGHRQLTREEAIGLFGELWFFLYWLDAGGDGDLQCWTGSEGSRHDFQWPAASVEVKTAVKSSGDWPEHTISSLEQLADPVQGNLYLFSLLVAEDPIARNSIDSLVSELTSRFESTGGEAEELTAALASRGVRPGASDEQTSTYRIRAERLYEVTGGFPRLTRETLGDAMVDGIVDASYRLATASCASWLVASSPSDELANWLRSTLEMWGRR